MQWSNQLKILKRHRSRVSIKARREEQPAEGPEQLNESSAGTKISHAWNQVSLSITFHDQDVPTKSAWFPVITRLAFKCKRNPPKTPFSASDALARATLVKMQSPAQHWYHSWACKRRCSLFGALKRRTHFEVCSGIPREGQGARRLALPCKPLPPLHSTAPS